MKQSSVDPSLATYLKEIRVTKLLTAQEEKDLSRRAHDGDQAARDRMTRANLRLVVSVARKFMNRGLPLADLIEEGNIGLLKAVDEFDPERGRRFSTYATYWIREHMRRALINSVRPIRIPAYMVEHIAKMKHAYDQLKGRLGRSPSPQELAKKLGMSPAKVMIIRQAFRMAGVGVAQQPVSQSVEYNFFDMLEDQRTRTPEDLVTELSEQSRVLELLDRMNEREAFVLRHRFGVGIETPLTLLEVGRLMRPKLTRERVRQIEMQALKKLARILREEGTDVAEARSTGSPSPLLALKKAAPIDDLPEIKKPQLPPALKTVAKPAARKGVKKSTSAREKTENNPPAPKVVPKDPAKKSGTKTATGKNAKKSARKKKS